jgi:undecaprenyl-diphosphatase
MLMARNGDDGRMSALVDWLVALPPWLVLAAAFVLPALEASAFLGLLVPGETALIVGGVVAHGGALPLWTVIAAGVTGAALGDQIGYRVGARFGQRLLARLPRRVRASGELDRALDLLRRRGAVAVVLGRWAAALRALIPGLAGMSGMAAGRFTAANLLGGTAWACAVAVLGYLAGAGYRTLERRLGLGGEIVLGLVALLVAVWVWRARRHRRAAGTPAT